MSELLLFLLGLVIIAFGIEAHLGAMCIFTGFAGGLLITPMIHLVRDMVSRRG
jgi:glucose-6-phosphate-specific signal transduction histidine kinase